MYTFMQNAYILAKYTKSLYYFDVIQKLLLLTNFRINFTAKDNLIYMNIWYTQNTFPGACWKSMRYVSPRKYGRRWCICLWHPVVYRDDIFCSYVIIAIIRKFTYFLTSRALALFSFVYFTQIANSFVFTNSKLPL